MAKKGPDFKVCPACGARNKLDWEYCARCSESLASAVAGAPTASAPREAANPDSPAGVGFPFGLIVGVVVVGALGVYWLKNRPEAEQPSPALFSVPANPSPGPPAGPVPSEDSRLREAQQMIRNRQSVDAVPILAQLASEKPNDPGVFASYARALWETGEKDAAIDAFRRAADLAPAGSVTARADLAQALVTLGRTDDAIREYETLAEVRGSPADLKELANLYVKAGRAADAVPLLSKAAAGAGSDATLLEVALAFEKAGATGEALNAFQKLLETRPDSDVVRLRLAEALYTSQRAEEAEATVRAGIERTPDKATLYRGLGSILERSGRSKEAATAYREYLKRAGNAGDAQDIADRAGKLEAGS